MDKEKKVSVALHTLRTSVGNLTLFHNYLSLNVKRYCISFFDKLTRVTEDGMSVKFWPKFNMTIESVS
jgi:hypothetical protein